jgi:precorrin-2 methylase
VEEVVKNKVLIEELEIPMEEAERNKCYYWNEELEILVEEVEKNKNIDGFLRDPIS